MATDRVTYKDVYDILERLETKFDSNMKEQQKELVGMIQNLEKRITPVETFQIRAMTVIGVFSGVFSLIITYIWNKVLGKE